MLLSKTLLFALAARACLAVRQGLKVDRSGTLSTVVEQITALIQAQGKSAVQSKATENIRMLAAITPGANGNLTKALTNVIAEIEQNVDEKIKAAFNEAQGKVGQSIHKIDTATTNALEKKSDADAADSTWFECMVVQENKRAMIETTMKAEQEATDSIPQPCNSQDASKSFVANPGAEDWSFACDFSEGTCDASTEAYEARVEGMLETLTADSKQATTVWTDHKKDCDTAKNNKEEATAARIAASNAWQSQKDVCQDNHGQRELKMCLFGTALQIKCTRVGEYKELIQKVDSPEGGEYSEADRKKEWETTHVTKCMLRKIIDGGDLDETTLENCASAKEVDYVGSVGMFDRQEDEFSNLISATSFTCEEESITFNGKTWIPPILQEDGLVPPAYTVVTPSSESINLPKGDAISVAFDFCAGAVHPPTGGLQPQPGGPTQKR